MEREFRRAVLRARENGQTVFLVSHQLAEVEAVCDRVAILRAGRLVDVAAVADLRRLHRTEVVVGYAGAAPDLAGIDGVDAVDAGADGRLRFTLTGPPGPALRRSPRRRDQPRGPRADAGGDLPRLLRRGVHGERRRRCGPRLAGDRVGRRRCHGLAVRQVRGARWSSSPPSRACRRWWWAPTGAPWATRWTRAALAALAANPAIRTLFGEPVALDDAGGFTVWRTGTVVAVLVGVWGALAATRITRGEEDAGRWDLLLAGRVPLPRDGGPAPRRAAGVVMVAAGRGGDRGAVRTGTDPAGAVLHGVGIGLIGAFFVAAARWPRRCSRRRAAASGATVAVLGCGLLARMVGDGVDALAWLRWLSPFGLLALTRPYDTNRGLPLRPAGLRRGGAGDRGGASRRPARRARRPARRRRPAAHHGWRCSVRSRGSRSAGCCARCWAGAGRRRLLPADRPDRRVDDRLPRRQPAVRRARRPGRLRRTRQRRRVRRDPVRAARRPGRGVRRRADRRVRRRRDRPAAHPARRPAARPGGGCSPPRPRRRWPARRFSPRPPARRPGPAPPRSGPTCASAPRWPGRGTPCRSRCCASARPWPRWAGCPGGPAPSACCPPPAGSCCTSPPTAPACPPGSASCLRSPTSRPCLRPASTGPRPRS